jgi:putative aldouronate transport system permease protein
VIEQRAHMPKRAAPRAKGRSALRKLRNNWQLYLLVLPALLYFLVFHYYPMYGLQIAFKNYRAIDGIWGSPWVGLLQFERFFNSFYFWTVIQNTFLINLYQLALFPVSVIVALSINELRDGVFKRVTQTLTYAPHFISVVVMVGILIAFLHPVTGIINIIVQALGGQPISFMTEPGWFKTIYVFSGEWQNLGWGAIIYLAALASVDPQLHEAAIMDGATRMQRIWHINLPSILPTIVILLILQMGNFMALGFEKIYLMQNPLNLSSSEVIQTYVYKTGLLQAQYSFSAAVGLFNSVINFIILISFNRLAKRVSGTGLW